MSGIMSMLLGAVSSAAAAVDEFFNRVTLLLPGNGTNGAQNNTFLDSSSNNFTITRNGNTTQGTFSPFSQTGWSNYFDGTGDYLTLADNAAFDLGTADFTFECWVYKPNNNEVSFLCSAATGLDFAYITAGGDTLRIGRYPVAWDAQVNYSIPQNAWTHIAFIKASGRSYFFANGTLLNAGGTANTNSYDTTTTLNVAVAGDGSRRLTGYMTGVRLIKGQALATASFTPPTAPVTTSTVGWTGAASSLTGTVSLLTCQSNRFIDISSNAFAITVNGDPSVQAFSPFAPTAAYSAATVGGSGYFDGTGDNLVTPSNTAFDPSGQNVTVNFWVYLTRYPQANNIVFEVGNSSVGDLQCNIVNTGEVRFTTGGNVGSTISGFNLNAWNYITCVKSGTSFTVYLNAVAGTGATLTPNSKTTMYVGSQSGGTNIEGYISNFRYVRGSANVPSSVPTAPLTAITNTSLLLNFTNAGITDATAKNDLETVGNAQISTTQSKFGGSSMYFDGTGDYALTISSVANSALGSGDWTVEFWLYTNVGSTTYNVIDWRPFATQGAYFSFYLNSGTPTYYTSSADRIVGGAAIPATTWTHVAVSRSGTSTKMFINGTQSGSTYTDTANYLGTVNRPAIGGGGSDANNTLNGYIDDLRVTRGYARYTANFTAPTSAFPLQ